MAFFGFEHVEDVIKTGRIKDLFTRVTNSYDVMNDVMSVGIHRLWKRSFINQLQLKQGDHILDMASGTGDIAQGIVEAYPFLDIQVTAVDLTESMLKTGHDRAIDRGILKGITYNVADAEALPFADDSFDVYVCAFGLRNVGNLEKALNESFRVLKPGGRFYCLEFSEVKTPGIKDVYDFYSNTIIPKMGEWIANDAKAYQYLVDSIRTFPNQEAFEELLHGAGYAAVRHENLSCGVTAIHTGMKV